MLAVRRCLLLGRRHQIGVSKGPSSYFDFTVHDRNQPTTRVHSFAGDRPWMHICHPVRVQVLETERQALEHDKAELLLEQARSMLAK